MLDFFFLVEFSVTIYTIYNIMWNKNFLKSTVKSRKTKLESSEKITLKT